METTRICFVDTETTGLIPGIHWPWEVAVIDTEVTEGSAILTVRSAQTFLLPIPKRLYGAIDPKANEIHKGPERHPEIFETPCRLARWAELLDAVEGVHKLLDGAVMAGNVIDFDARMLEFVFDYTGTAPYRPWNYHLIDVENVVAGVLHAFPPYKSTQLSALLGVPEPEVAHTAMGDADWSLRMYAKCHGLVVQHPMFEESK